MKNKSGFTLIELLVVISIIGILMSVSLVAVTSSQKQARDAQRRSDLGQYRVALESYATSNNGKYPGFAAANPNLSTMAGSAAVNGLSSYMSAVIYDPKNAGLVGTCPPNPATPAFGYCYLEDAVADGANSSAYIIYNALETGGYWVVCSNGKAGKTSGAPSAALPLTCNVP